MAKARRKENETIDNEQMNRLFDIQTSRAKTSMQVSPLAFGNRSKVENVEEPNVVYVIERRKRIMEMIRRHEECAELKRQKRLRDTEDYVSLVFIHVGASVEDVEKVCDVVRLFIETGCIIADKEFSIAYNKKLRNAEIKYLVNNIVKHNEKEHLDVELFLQTVFGEWFKVKDKGNISKNYNVLPKDSCISKEGLEADMDRLRCMLNTDGVDRT